MLWKVGVLVGFAEDGEDQRDTSPHYKPVSNWDTRMQHQRNTDQLSFHLATTLAPVFPQGHQGWILTENGLLAQEQLLLSICRLPRGDGSAVQQNLRTLTCIRLGLANRHVREHGLDVPVGSESLTESLVTSTMPVWKVGLETAMPEGLRVRSTMLSGFGQRDGAVVLCVGESSGV